MFKRNLLKSLLFFLVKSYIVQRTCCFKFLLKIRRMKLCTCDNLILFLKHPQQLLLWTFFLYGYGNIFSNTNYHGRPQNSFSAIAIHFVGILFLIKKKSTQMSYFVHNILQMANSFVTNKMLPALKIILTSIDPRTKTD